MSLELSDTRYLAALKRIRSNIVSGTNLSHYDENEIGNKIIECSWGFCSSRRENWPDSKDHMFPNNGGRIITKELKDHQLCPLDRKLDSDSQDDSQGCFFTCKIFQKVKGENVPDKTEVIALYDKAIERANNRKKK